jgi:hypothetical protein
MSEAPEQDAGQDWPRRCPACGTELQQATLDMDTTNAPRPEYRPGEHVAVTFCPNPECPEHPRP